MRPIVFCLLAASLSLAFQGEVAFGVTFTTTPAAVSNTYSGFITLTIAGLTNKESVVIQKYIDMNTNGVIDASDLLVQQFTLTDGTNSVIGGVTNLNVPGDLNATTGAITATLNYKMAIFCRTSSAGIFINCPVPSAILPR